MNPYYILYALLIILLGTFAVKGIRFFKICVHNIRTMDDPLFSKIDNLKYPLSSRNNEIVICAIKRMYKENGLLDQQVRKMEKGEALEYLWSRKLYLDDVIGFFNNSFAAVSPAGPAPTIIISYIFFPFPFYYIYLTLIYLYFQYKI